MSTLGKFLITVINKNNVFIARILLSLVFVTSDLS